MNKFASRADVFEIARSVQQLRDVVATGRSPVAREQLTAELLRYGGSGARTPQFANWPPPAVDRRRPGAALKIALEYPAPIAAAAIGRAEADVRYFQAKSDDLLLLAHALGNVDPAS